MSARVHLLQRERGETEFDFVTRVLRAVPLKDVIGPDEERVLVNPNWVVAEHSSLGNVTSTEVLRALVSYLIEEARIPPQRIVVADGGEPVTSLRVIDINGVERLHREYGVVVKNLLNDETVPGIPVPNPLSLAAVNLARTAWEASCIIAVPVLKTHSMAVTTMSCKKMMGCLSPPRELMHEDIHRRVPDLVSVLRSKMKFQLVGGITASEGDETSGRPLRMDLLIAGTDPVAVDAVGSAVMGYGPEEARYLGFASEKGLGTSDLERIEVVGGTISAVSRKFRPAADFQPTDSQRRFAGSAARLFGSRAGIILPRVAVAARLYGWGHVARKVWLKLRLTAGRSLYRTLARKGWYWGELAKWRASGTDAAVYREWLVRRRALRCELTYLRLKQEELRYRPRLTFISRADGADGERLIETGRSLLDQAYPLWEWILVDSSQGVAARSACARLGGDPRIRVAQVAGGTPASAENAALSQATGDYTGYIEAGDELAPEAFFDVAAWLNQAPDADMLYSDEDRVFPDGSHGDPFFKPDWCPDSFLSRAYTGALCLFRTDLARGVGGLREGFADSRVADLVLRLTELGGRVVHVPNVLYHRRSGAPIPPASPEHVRALREASERRREPAEIREAESHPGIYFVRYRIDERKPVSIITWTRDEGDYLEGCLESVFERSTFRDFEWILTDNGSHSRKTADVIQHWRQSEPQRFKPNRLETDDFNFSLLCNHGAALARGEYLLFLSNDTRVISEDWIEALMEQAQRREIGAVGAMLLYEDETLQHAGALMGLGGLAGHSHRGFHRELPGYFGQIQSVNNYLMVAASCMMVRASVFREAGGFDEALPFDYGDVDFCLKLHRLGYRNLYLPYVRAFHYEDKDHGPRQALLDPGLFERSARRICKAWPEFIHHDPCYNPNLTRAAEDYAIAVPVSR